METRQTRKLTAGVKTLLIVAASFACGFMSLTALNGCFGAVISRFALSVMLTLLIFAFYGNRKSVTYELIPVSAGLLCFGSPLLFALFAGSLFSKKQYKIRSHVLILCLNYALTAGLLLAVKYLLPIVSPTAAEYAMNFAYLNEACFAAASVLTYAISSAAIFRDGAAALISAVLFVAYVALRAADIAVFSRFPVIPVPKFIVGFLFGFITLTVLACLPAKISAGEGRFEYAEPFARKGFHAFYSTVFTLFLSFALSVLLLAAGSLKQFVDGKIFPQKAPWIFFAITAVICLIGIAVCASVSRKNIISRGLPVPAAMRAEDFCMKAAPVYFAVTGVISLVNSRATFVNIPFDKFKSLSSLIGMIRGGVLTEAAVTALSFVLFFVFYFAARGKAVRRK